MPTALVVGASEHLIPEEHAIAMVEACARQLASVSTIPDVLKMVTQADAIAAVMHKIKASKTAQKAALRLRVEAEAQLGRITARIPLGGRGGAAIPGQHTKRKALSDNGIHNYRASTAEKLARRPKEEVEAAIERAKSPGLYGVMNDLGIRKPWREYQIPEKTARDTDFLADEAISLLERSAKVQQPPHSGTVAEMRTRLNRLRVQDR